MAKRKGRGELAATIVLSVATLGLIWIVPDNPLAHLGDPPFIAIVAYLLTLVALAALRPFGTRGYRLERVLLSVFLVGMPLVYVASSVLHGSGRLAFMLELAGLALYATLALLGRVRSFRFVALGIAAHALWDIAQYGRTDYIPDWYSIACVLVDTTLGLFVWSRLSRPGYVARTGRLS